MTQQKNTKLSLCESLVENRLEKMPNHIIFSYLKKQLEYIRSNLKPNGRLPNEIFEKLNIGAICAKELEPIDMEFCNAAYAMLDEVGPKVVFDFL